MPGWLDDDSPHPPAGKPGRSAASYDNLGPIDAFVQSFNLRDLWCDIDEQNIKQYEDRMNISAEHTATRTRRRRHNIYRGSHERNIMQLVRLCCKIPVLHPMGPFKLWWNAVGLCLIMYDILFLPMQVFDIGHTGPFVVIEWLCTIVWTVDLVLNFRTAFFVQRSLETNSWDIAAHYVKTWFAVDLLTVGIEWLASFIDVLGSATLLRTSRIFRATRLFKLARLAKMPSVWLLIHESINSNVFKLCLNMAGMTMVLCLLIHIVSCLWYTMGDNSANGWTSYDAYNGDKSTLFWYLASARWVIAQVNGRTDMDDDRNVQERAFTCVINILLAVLAKSFFTSLITKSLLHLSELTSEKTTRNLMVNDYLDNHGIELHTISSVKRFMANYQDPGREQKREKQVHAFLPMHLQKELMFQVRSPSLLHHNLFATVCAEEPLTFQAICSGIVHLLAVRECERVFDFGDACSRLLFVDRGTATYSAASPSEDEVCFTRKRTSSISTLSSSLSRDSCCMAQDVCRGMWLSEPALWVNWHNKGRLEAQSFMCLHTIDAADLAALLLKTSSQEYARAVLYAKKFIEVLGNQHYLSDITDFHVRAETIRPESARLLITVLQAVGLPDTDVLFSHGGPQPDPYCVCQILGLRKQTAATRFRTKVIPNTLDPVWDHSAVVHHLHPSQPLQFQVWEEGSFPIPDRRLGTAQLDSSEFLPRGFDGELRLTGSRASGSVHVKVEVLN